MKFQVGDKVRRMEDALAKNDKIVKGREYVVSKVLDWCSDPIENRYIIKLDGFVETWDAWRFEYVSPWVQACPCGIHWTECEEHKR
jgi:hypothetical protein